MNTFLTQFFDVTLDMAPWLLAGLVAAGLVKALIPESFIMRWLGGRGIGPITRGALVGAPLPLCSCSVIPMAMGLRRNGASKSSTVSFMVATPETGVDSIALSWVMLGPFMTVARPVCAIISAIYSGFLTMIVEIYEAKAELKTRMVAKSSTAPGSNDIPVAVTSGTAETTEGSDCSSGCCGSSKAARQVQPQKQSVWNKIKEGVGYAMTNLWDDIAAWLLLGIVVTALVKTLLPDGNIQAFSDHNVLTMLVLVAASVPVYVCATASTPMAAAMLFSGMTPGVVLAFLIAGPGTNIAPLALIKKEMGWRTMIAYVAGIVTSAIGLGLLADWMVVDWNLLPDGNLNIQAVEAVPLWLSAGSTLLLLLFALRKPLARLLVFTRPVAGAFKKAG